ncbi:hypothetical protein NPIL_521871 [Nephila pilipes]|uniref:Uncharacterized protein n=1 Tax=Nephila pilipes TaxID=299642 RepID=A0A8X6T9D6_NEPPI|nr:hypothetical protein NPIL_521871 [Nephila pilipes]
MEVRYSCRAIRTICYLIELDDGCIIKRYFYQLCQVERQLPQSQFEPLPIINKLVTFNDYIDTREIPDRSITSSFFQTKTARDVTSNPSLNLTARPNVSPGQTEISEE